MREAVRQQGGSLVQTLASFLLRRFGENYRRKLSERLNRKMEKVIEFDEFGRFSVSVDFGTFVAGGQNIAELANAACSGYEAQVYKSDPNVACQTRYGPNAGCLGSGSTGQDNYVCYNAQNGYNPGSNIGCFFGPGAQTANNIVCLQNPACSSNANC